MARQEQANDVFALTSFLYGGNADYIEELYAKYEDDPNSVDPQWRDPINDSDDSEANLMFFSELGGELLSAGQKEILTRSPVLR